MTTTDPMTKEYWLRVQAALKFVEGIPTAALEGRTLGEVLAFLERISRPHDCGCSPCYGQCTSNEALMIERDELRDAAASILSHFRPRPSDNQEEQSDG